MVQTLGVCSNDGLRQRGERHFNKGFMVMGDWRSAFQSP